jgi:hypothetical protein
MNKKEEHGIIIVSNCEISNFSRTFYYLDKSKWISSKLFKEKGYEFETT